MFIHLIIVILSTAQILLVINKNGTYSLSQGYLFYYLFMDDTVRIVLTYLNKYQ